MLLEVEVDIFLDKHKLRMRLKEGEYLKGVGFARHDNIDLDIQSFWVGDFGCSFEFVPMSLDMSKMEVLRKDSK